jgi:hypothetical protein
MARAIVKQFQSSKLRARIEGESRVWQHLLRLFGRIGFDGWAIADAAALPAAECRKANG